MNQWPTQAQCDAFYGNPRGLRGRSSPAWENANLTSITPPFKMAYVGSPVHSVKIHRKCAASLQRVFNAIWEAAKHDQATINRWGVSIFGGSYNFRQMRGSSHLSMHSYGCAIDLAPNRFPFGSHAQTFVPQVIKAFADEGWVNLPNDRMHFQAARVSGVPLPKLTVIPKPAVLKSASKLVENIPMNKNTVNLTSLAALAGAIGYLLPTIIQTWQTSGLAAAAILIVGFIAQLLLPVGTVHAVEDAAIQAIPTVETLDPALKPLLEQIAAGLRAAEAAKVPQ